jgi:hypothetical protein
MIVISNKIYYFIFILNFIIKNDQRAKRFLFIVVFVISSHGRSYSTFLSSWLVVVKIKK